MDSAGVFGLVAAGGIATFGCVAAARAWLAGGTCYHGAYPADADGIVHLELVAFVAVDAPESAYRNTTNPYGQHWICARCGAAWHRDAIRCLMPDDSAETWPDLVIDAVMSTHRPAVAVPPPGATVYLRGPRDDGPTHQGALTPA